MLGDKVSFDAMVTLSGDCREDETRPERPSDPSRFELYAHLAWDGLLRHEEIVDR